MAELIQQLRTSRLVPALGLAVALAILGGAIFLGTHRLRQNLREQMLSRDGEILHAVALAQQFSSEASSNLGARLKDPAEQLALALNISQLKDDVLAVRLYDAAGEFVTAFPPNTTEAPLDRITLARLQELHPVSRYQRDARLSELFFSPRPAATSNTTPLMEVSIPLHVRGQTQMLGAAQLVLDAHNLERAFARLDANLWRQALLAFLAGGGLLSAALIWAYRRLERTHALLQERTARLLRANHELALAAKTGALGAVTAHLVHGLSNPLANLQDFVASRRSGSDDDQWQDLVAATRRMQQLVHDVVRVLGEEHGADHYEITLAELAGILNDKVRPAAERAGVGWETQLTASGHLANRHANLVLLILENLALNALQVTPCGRHVRLSLAPAADGVVCAVADEGPGFPPHLRKSLFAPCRSTKGGSGLGLAISKQLTNQLGAELQLQRTGPNGCTFALTLPRALLAGAEREMAALDSPAGCRLTPAGKPAD